MGDTGSRKSTITAIVVTGLLAAHEPLLALVVAVTYLGINGLLHLVGQDGVDDSGESE